MTIPTEAAQEQYPSKEQHLEWWAEGLALHKGPSIKKAVEHVVRKACDWKEQQAVDACLAYERESIWGADNSYHWSDIRGDLVDAIRIPHPQQPRATK